MFFYLAVIMGAECDFVFYKPAITPGIFEMIQTNLKALLL